MNLTIFGHTGFIGKNYLEFTKPANLQLFERRIFDGSNKFEISPESFAVLNFIGKAHDFKKHNVPKEYYSVNTELTKRIYDQFLLSNSEVFITISSVKAVAETLDNILTEDFIAKPITDYGKSKLLAEHYILRKSIPNGKRVYILRPCMIHGPYNKGHLNLLYKVISICSLWPLGAYKNMRSFCSIDNLCFIINELIENDKIPSGVYNVSDDEPLSTNEVISLITYSLEKKSFILNIPKFLVKFFSKIGDVFNLPFNTERLNKLTESYVVSNHKLRNAINKSLPVTSKEGLLKTFNSFKNAE